jgi:hypothetical protein
MTKPNWRVWLLMPDVKVWQACVLSIGLEPESMEPEDFNWMDDNGKGPYFTSESFPNSEAEKKYNDCLKALGANLFDREYFSAGVINGNGAGLCSVRLNEFARWATLKAPWLDLPPELAGLVLDKTNGNSAQTNKTNQNNSYQASDNKKSTVRDKGLKQQDAIVTELERLGYSPLRLPAFEKGKRSAKANALDGLTGQDLFTAPSAFENAWQELTRRNRIKFET